MYVNKYYTVCIYTYMYIYILIIYLEIHIVPPIIHTRSSKLYFFVEYKHSPKQNILGQFSQTILFMRQKIELNFIELFCLLFYQFFSFILILILYLFCILILVILNTN